MLFSKSVVLQPAVYGFIDGAYLDILGGEVGLKYFGEPMEFNYKSFCVGSKKIFYYDCLPSKKNSETEEQYGARRQKKEEHFKAISAFDGWHVSRGVGKWSRKLGQNQKEVDILIAVDMLTHSYKKNMDSLIFIAGDLDFRPLLEAIVADGMDVTLQYGEGAAEDLVHAADKKIPLTVQRLYEHCSEEYKQRNQLPSTAFVACVESANVIEIGTVDGKKVALLERHLDGSFGIIDTRNPSVYVYHGTCESSSKLKHFYAASVLACEWKCILST